RCRHAPAVGRKAATAGRDPSRQARSNCATASSTRTHSSSVNGRPAWAPRSIIGHLGDAPGTTADTSAARGAESRQALPLWTGARTATPDLMSAQFVPLLHEIVTLGPRNGVPGGFLV